MTENVPAVPERRELAVPGTGELVDLNDEQSCARALATVRDFESELREVKGILTGAIVERSKVLGSKTIPLEDGRVATVSTDREVVYDAEAIEQAFRELGMPEERIREIVEETVTYKVKAVEAKRAAGANPEYDRVLKENARDVDKTPYVSIRRR